MEFPPPGPGLCRADRELFWQGGGLARNSNKRAAGAG